MGRDDVRQDVGRASRGRQHAGTALRVLVDATYDAVMRTTVDLPDDVHRAAMQVARDRHQTFSRTVAGLLRSALTGEQHTRPIEVDPDTGLPTLHVGGRITAEDVAVAGDDD
jgi:hypothetical protein